MKIGFVNFTPMVYSVDTPYKEPLGGSESAMCYLAEALAKRGHLVTLFGRLPKALTLRGVRHEPDKNLKKSKGKDLDFLIIQNTPYYGLELKAVLGKKTKLIFWSGHAADQPAVQGLGDKRILTTYDAFVFVSGWQMESFVQTFPIGRRKCMILRNAISPAFENLFPEEENVLSKKSQPPVLVYTSTPYRGLELLIELFPKIRKEVPDVILKIFSSLQVYQHTKESDAQDYGRLYSLFQKTEGIKYCGSLSQPQLAKELKPALVFAYPNTFPETSCISIMEAMAAGCQIITSRFGALPETAAGFATLIPLGETKEDYIENFTRQTVNVLRQFLSGKSKNLSENLSRQLTFVKNCYTWERRAIEWEKWLISLLKKL